MDESTDAKEREYVSTSLLVSEKDLLFGRLCEVFDLPASKLQELFLESSDTEFEKMKKYLLPFSGSSSGKSADEGSSSSSTDDVSGSLLPAPKSKRGSSLLLLQYVRPSLPDPVPHDDPRREDYLQSLTDILLYALSHRDMELVEQIVATAPEVASTLKAEDLSVLLYSNPSYKTLHTLLQEGVDPNTFDKYGSTLLHKYVLDKDMDFIKLLLSFSADCNIEDRQNQRCAVQLAALQGDFDALYAMIATSKIPVKIDKPDFDGNSLLHLVLQSEFPAVQYKSITMLLLDRGLSPAARNLHGETPLHYFCVNQSLCGIPFIEPLFEMLLEALALGWRSDSSSSSVRNSSSSSSSDSRGGSSVNLCDDDDCTPLIIACAHREWELCKLLLLSGADMNIPCSMSSKLLTRGCDTTRRGLGGVTDFQADCTTGDLMPRSVRQKIFPYISSAQSLIDLTSRDRCMNCAAQFTDPAASTSHIIAVAGGLVSLFTAEPKTHCRNCGRVVCQECIVQSDLPFDQLPDYLKEASSSSSSSSDRSSGSSARSRSRSDSGSGKEATVTHPHAHSGEDIRACVVCHPILSKDMKIAKFW